MNRQADVVVIGSGALGTSTAFHLAELGQRVILVEKFDFVSQSSPRAAGLAQAVQVDDVLADLAIRGIRMLTGFAEMTGEALDVFVNGSIKLARRPGDAAQLAEEVRRGRELGVEIDLVSPDEARRVAPWLEPDGALSISYTPGDLYLEPGDLPRATLRAFAARGGEALDHAEVREVLLSDGKVSGVVTAKGTIEAPVVVDAAGAWTRLVGDLVDEVVPLWPVRHQLCITEPLAQVDPLHATVRVMDAKVYVRPANGGLMFGGYEPDPLVVDPRERDAAFQVSDLVVDETPLRRQMGYVASELPVFADARIAELRGGLPTMTPDGHFLIDRLAEVPGFWVASGCNVGGLSISPPIGQDIAGWIVAGGARPAHLEAFRIDRFSGRFTRDDELREACVATYAHKYHELEVQG